MGITACSSNNNDAQDASASQTETTTPVSSAPASATSAGASAASTSKTSEGSEASESSEASRPANPSETTSARGGDKGASKSAGRGEPADGELEPSVTKAYALFSELAPKSLFERFDKCDSAGIRDSYNCAGSEVGQVQFFKSDSKATQTTQVLTELRSSRVVQDSGDRVVGWSTLGTTAVLTVVNNKEGLVMQQMISTDEIEPEEQLKTLGLV